MGIDLPTCRELTDKARDYMDDALTAGERLKLRFHLMTCRTCRRYLRRIEVTTTAFQQMQQGNDALAEPPR